MEQELKGKRLLVLAGVNPIAVDVVRVAREMGAYVIVTGNLDVSSTPAKQYADEVSDVSTADLDALEQLMDEKHIDGVLTGSSEFAIERVISLCERRNLPCYCTREQWEICSDKDRFKNLCRQYDVPVVPEYYIEEKDGSFDISGIRYPVIVKPTDGSGGGGISVCNNDEEMIRACERAKNYSHAGRILVEEYIDGDEIGVSYAVKDGKVVMTAMHDRYLHRGEAGFMRLPLVYVYPSIYTDSYLEKQNEKVVKMFEGIGLKNGTLFIQGFGGHDKCMFYELGYRFNGAKQYNLLKEEDGFSTMEMVIRHALTGSEGDFDLEKLADPRFDNVYSTISLIVHPGHIDKIVGLEELKKMDSVLDVSPWYHDGQTIDKSLIGTQRQISCRVTLKTKDRKSMADAIDRVYEVYDVIDENGNSLMMEGFDTDILRNQ